MFIRMIYYKLFVLFVCMSLSYGYAPTDEVTKVATAAANYI